MDNLSQITQEFILNHRKDNVKLLALQYSKQTCININEAITQIAGWQIAEKKIPSWAKQEGIIYPQHLSMEQCSSEVTAKYKSSLIAGESFVDLTAGFGVDCSFMASKFKKVHYVERQKELCKIAEHNFQTLGLNHITIHNTDGIDFLKEMNKVDCIFLDPARRDSHGSKTVAICDCEPDIRTIEDMLVDKGQTVIIKLSPMLDIYSAMNDLKYLKDLHIVSVNNECKELVAILQKDINNSNINKDKINIECEQILTNSQSQHFKFNFSEEKTTEIEYSDSIENYLYEPGASLLKAGPFKLISKTFGIKKLHPNSHLYTSKEKIKNFPGRQFKVTNVSTFNKKELKTFLQGLEKANITIRNFPSTVADLRKRLKLNEGGDIYIFATTLGSGEKVLIKCQKD